MIPDPFKSLIKASKELKCDNLLIITWDYEAKEIYKKMEIDFMPLWKWLLN
jgi:predicted AAA+ superfamily ATPase